MESPIRRSRESKKGRTVPEINNMEHINTQLKGKLKVLTIEMKDAVERMNSMTVEMNSIKNENQLCKDRLAELEQENALLVSQIEEMANERAERDAVIEEFSTAVEARIVEWKEILDEKDSTIAKLKENLLCAASERPASGSPEEAGSSSELERLVQDIGRRDVIIAELQSKLSEAVVEINESSLLIEKFKSEPHSSKRRAKEQRETNKKSEDISKRISILENLLERAEKDAKVKSEQLCEALAILNKYEDENTSLYEALEEIKDLKVQVEKKNKHIEDLVDVVNRLEMENSRYEEIIIVLRDKIEFTEDDEFSLDNLILERQKAQEEKAEDIQRNFDQLSSENVDLKFQIRKLKTALKKSLKSKLSKTNGMVSDGDHTEELSQQSELQTDQLELRRAKEDIKWVIEENEALRQGMHEILDAIHDQDGKSLVNIQSQTLENLLDALDARHLAGWYHPAMRLQGRVNYLQGSNAELRAQLQQIRENQLLQESETQQRSSSVEEGECRQTAGPEDTRKASELPATPSGSRDATPKSARSAHSPNADSGRASGKAAESDELLQPETPEPGPLASESPGDTPMNDIPDETPAASGAETAPSRPAAAQQPQAQRTEETYAMAKELLAQESEFREALAAAEHRQRELEARIVGLRKSLASHVAPEVHAELRHKYLEASARLRAALEDRLANGPAGEEPLQRALAELREELLGVHARLTELVAASAGLARGPETRSLEELEARLAELRGENEALRRSAEIAREEAHAHRAIDSSLLAELNELRRRLASLGDEAAQGGPEGGKESARLALEIVNYKVVETELRERKAILERDLKLAREELADMHRRRESDGEIREESRRKVDHGHYIEIIDFLQHQYAGSTSLSAYERYEASLNKLNNDRNEVKELIAKINEQNESLKIHHETLTGRLQIVEQLKDMLEQQIGSNEVQDIMQRFTNETKQILAESKYKMQISQLEEESRRAKKGLTESEARLALMERELSGAQRAWRALRPPRHAPGLDKAIQLELQPEPQPEPQPKPQLTRETKCAQTEMETRSVETQCAESPSDPPKPENRLPEESEPGFRESEDELSAKGEKSSSEAAASASLLQEQLGQALSLASERSIALSRSESQLVELRAKLAALEKLRGERPEHREPTKPGSPQGPRVATSLEALQSTVKTLEKIVAQKEETIARYQGLLKDDRDKHSEAAARLQEEIKSLRSRLSAEGPRRMLDNDALARSECPERDLPAAGESCRASEEPASILREKICRLETELGMSAELAERWHRLAEDRLRHMDSTRERLEEQHKEEIESYRKELNKRQQEINELRRQISESRRAPSTKTEVLSFMKALQIKDNRLADEIENELEEHVTAGSHQQQQQQQQTAYGTDDTRLAEIEQSQSQLDSLRRQLQASMERERAHKSEIAELQQQLSRRHVAGKAQEKKASRREMQLERRVKELEEELHEARDILERHFMLQQAKRAKTAEDLGLWDKLKKWQQTAERLNKRLKEKTDECQRLQASQDRLRGLIGCMEREKLFLRERKCPRAESAPATPAPESPANDALVEELRAECQELRRRFRELLARLSRRDDEPNDERKLAAFEDDECINAELKRLREMQEIHEKENLRLEAENFELRLELERANVNLPRYEEKIQHLEKYIELLKSEKAVESVARREGGVQRTKAELERTVRTLKGLVERLQQENKRLRAAASQGELLEARCNCAYLREEYEQAKHRAALLETELELARRRIGLMAEAATAAGEPDRPAEVAALRDQLGRKSELLARVKDLLAKATANEKALRQRIQQLEFKQTLSAIPECGTSLAMM